jgi:hypothetical protein
MSIEHTLICDLCHARYLPPATGAVGEVRAWARKEGWQVRHGEPDLCPMCLAADRAELFAYAARRREIRTAVKKGAKQADVAREHGVSRQRISQIVKGA